MRRSTFLRSLAKRASSVLAGALVIATMGAGLVESWHVDEHADEEHCVDCALCDLSSSGPIADGSEVGEVDEPTHFYEMPVSEGRLSSSDGRRSDAARAPPNQA